MVQFLIRRFLLLIPTLFAVSIVTFAIIQLPAGDYVTAYTANLATSGETLDQQTLDALRERFAFDQPVYVQYYKWMSNIITKGDFGYSFVYRRDAKKIIAERLPITFIVSSFSVLFSWIVALPIGIYSAVKKYSLTDYLVTLIGFVGLAVPSFLFALVLMFISYKYMDQAMIGLFSREYEAAPWSFAKFWDLVKHLWIPVIIIGTAGTAGLIRTMRANLLDELNKPYVDTARSKGLTEARLLWKYPVRHALNPFVSTVGWVLPTLVAGEVIVSIVLNLPTSGPVLYQALLQQDMYVAAGFLLVISSLTILGTFVSDLLLAVLDPRIRLQ